VHQQKNGQHPEGWAPVCWETLWDTSFGGSDNYVAAVDPSKENNWDDLKSTSNWEESKIKEESSKEGSPLLGHLTSVFNPDSMTALLADDALRINEFEVDSQGFLLDNDSDSSVGGGDRPPHPNLSASNGFSSNSSGSEYEQEDNFSQFWNNSYWGDNGLNGLDPTRGAFRLNGNEDLSVEEAMSVFSPNGSRSPHQGEEEQQQSPTSSLQLGDNEAEMMSMDPSLAVSSNPSSSDLSSALPTPSFSDTPSSPFSSTESSPAQGSSLESDPLKAMLWQLLLTRDAVGRWLEDPYFDRLVKGCFVRAVVGSTIRSSSNGVPSPVYRIARIVEVQNNCYPSYTLEPHHNLHPTRKGVMLQFGSTVRMVSLQAISNKAPSDQEYREWREEAEKTNEKIGLSMEEVQEKLEIFQLLDMKYPNVGKYSGENVNIKFHPQSQDLSNENNRSLELDSYSYTN